MKRWIVVLVLFAVALTGGALGGAAWWRHAVEQPGPLPAGKAVLVPHGGTDTLAQALAADGVIDRPLLFKAAVWASREQGPLRAAEFAFPPHASLTQVLAILRTARPVEHHVTIPEGLTAQQIRLVLAHAEAMNGPLPVFAEGSVLPETYSYTFGTPPASVIARAQAAMDKTLAAAWANRASNLPLGSAHEALVLASIVERETARPEERPRVAAVYLNRLRQGMRLQADPTVVYAASGGLGVLDHGLTKAELGKEDPFNTYRNAGLPPSPICSPSVASLEAVVHPAASDELYLVADGTGGHAFSRTLETHEAAVRQRTLLPQGSHGSPD
ncbi:MAG: endolytic transglycosylase MltG [Rhodopila sp.]